MPHISLAMTNDMAKLNSKGMEKCNEDITRNRQELEIGEHQ